MELFSGKETVHIRLAAGECSYVVLAAEDLCRDIGRVGLGARGVLGTENAKLFVGTKGNEGILALPHAAELSERLTHREE